MLSYVQFNNSGNCLESLNFNSSSHPFVNFELERMINCKCLYLNNRVENVKLLLLMTLLDYIDMKNYDISKTPPIKINFTIDTSNTI